MSEHSRLVVVMPGRDVAHLTRNFPEALASMLKRLQLPPDVIARELEASRQIVVTATDSRSMLGSLSDFAALAQHRLRDEPEADLASLSTWLAHTPVAPLGFEFPSDVARRLLQ